MARCQPTATQEEHCVLRGESFFGLSVALESADDEGTARSIAPSERHRKHQSRLRERNLSSTFCAESCIAIACRRLGINRLWVPILLVVGQTLFFPLSPFTPENLISRDRFGRPVPSHVSPLILYIQANVQSHKKKDKTTLRLPQELVLALSACISISAKYVLTTGPPHSHAIPHSVSVTKRTRTGTTARHIDLGDRVTSDSTPRTNTGVAPIDQVAAAEGRRRQSSREAARVSLGMAGQASRVSTSPETSRL